MLQVSVIFFLQGRKGLLFKVEGKNIYLCNLCVGLFIYVHPAIMCGND